MRQTLQMLVRRRYRGPRRGGADAWLVVIAFIGSLIVREVYLASWNAHETRSDRRSYRDVRCRTASSRHATIWLARRERAMFHAQNLQSDLQLVPRSRILLSHLQTQVMPLFTRRSEAGSCSFLPSIEVVKGTVTRSSFPVLSSRILSCATAAAWSIDRPRFQNTGALSAFYDDRGSLVASLSRRRQSALGLYDSGIENCSVETVRSAPLCTRRRGGQRSMLSPLHSWTSPDPFAGCYTMCPCASSCCIVRQGSTALVAPLRRAEPSSNYSCGEEMMCPAARSVTARTIPELHM